MENIINLYANRSIRNVKTAINLVELLQTASYNLSGIKKYNTLSTKYGGALAITYNKVKYVDRHKKAIIKIQRHLANTVLFDAIKRENAMDNNVIDISVAPQRVGSDIMNTTHIRSVLEQAYSKVIKNAT